VTPTDIAANYDRFTTSAFRLESLPQYKVESETASIEAFLRGEPRPERSVRTQAWLARIAKTTVVDGKCWSRVHIIDFPLSDYVRYELEGYVESQAAGERIGIIDRARNPEFSELREDFWLFDAETDQPFAHAQLYTPDGAYKGARPVTDHAELARYIDIKNRTEAAAEPLNVFLAGLARS
jgi:hypothetical protein